MFNPIKLISAGVVALIALIAVTWAFDYTKVPAGHVGIKYNLYGTDKGVQLQEKIPGRYILGPNEEMYLFPTFTVTDTYTGPQSIQFQDKEGLQLAGNFGVTYAVDSTKVTTLFQKYRKGIEEISDRYVRNVVRNAIVNASSTRNAEEMYGSGKAELMKSVESAVRAELAPIGILVENVYAIGAFTVPGNISSSINKKVEAQQIAQQKENELQQSEADAAKARAVAQGEKDAEVLRAEGKAQALNIEGEALRKNPGISELRAIEKWNGQLPTFIGSGATPFVQVPTK
jgi:regulator of protease activity HflC (stomatin/prohibitin superfamily)